MSETTGEKEKQLKELFAGISKAIEDATIAMQNMAQAVGQVCSDVFNSPVFALHRLALKDRYGKNIVKGKERRKLKLIVSKYRRCGSYRIYSDADHAETWNPISRNAS